SYCCDRARSITWGIEGGLPSIPHGVWLNKGSDDERFLGATFSNVPVGPGDWFTRPSAGGGGFGDPLTRDPDDVLEDVIDGYVSVERAGKDYGVVVREVDPELDQYEIDRTATKALRAEISSNRRGWLEEDAEDVALRYRTGELDVLDLVRRYAVIVDWGTGALLENTTRQYRELVQQRSARHWS
ncbi:MAG: hydantoinase B/oxoprolinase family protein, partial [Actinomycetes bacterium]